MSKKEKINPYVFGALGFVVLGIIALVLKALDEILLRIDLYGLFSWEVCYIFIFLPVQIIAWLIGVAFFGAVILAVISFISELFSPNKR